MDYTVSAYLIDETWLKANTSINANVDVRLLIPHVRVAQDLFIQPILGTKLYQRLMEGIVASNLTQNEINLIDIVRPALAYYTLATGIPYLGIEVRGSGVVRAKNEKIEPATVAEMNILINSATNTAEFYAQRIKNWLCANSSLYSQYNTETTAIRPEGGSSFNAGLYYGNSKKSSMFYGSEDENGPCC